MTGTARVLYIDDEPDMGVLLEMQQSAMPGIEFVHVLSVAAALAYLDEHMSGPLACAVVCTDLRMPDMMGYEFLDICGAKFPFIPVIVVTASTDIASAREATERGAFDFVTKPINFGQFYLILQRAIVNAERHRNVLTVLEREADRLRATELQLREVLRVMTGTVKKRTEQLHAGHK